MKKLIIFIIVLALAFIATSAVVSIIKNKKNNTNISSNPASQSLKSDESKQASTNLPPISTYNVPILMYHYIRDFNDPDDEIGTNLSVSPKTFETQLKWLKENGYQSVSLSNLVNRSFDSFDSTQDKSAQDQNDKFVILTFDDGYQDAYTNAFPLLKKYSFTATFYIIINYVGRDNYMNWEQIKELKNAGMNIGSHSLSHPDLQKSTDERVDKEIGESKEVLSERLANAKTQNEAKAQNMITDFCYPSGKYDERTIEVLKKYGYQTAVTVKNGLADQDSDLFELPRIRVTNETNLSKILD